MALTDPNKDTSALPVIAVGFDGSSSAEAALDWATLEAGLGVLRGDGTRAW